jgi:hypothetical protein
MYIFLGECETHGRMFIKYSFESTFQLWVRNELVQVHWSMKICLSKGDLCLELVMCAHAWSWTLTNEESLTFAHIFLALIVMNTVVILWVNSKERCFFVLYMVDLKNYYFCIEACSWLYNSVNQRMFLKLCSYSKIKWIILIWKA